MTETIRKRSVHKGTSRGNVQATMEVVDEFRKMKPTRSPRFIVEMMGELNDNQLRAVEEMGFGHLIHFNITDIPSLISYGLLQKFDSLRCSIMLGNERIHISDNDVHLTMGFPRGGRMIVRSLRQDNQQLVDEIARAGQKHRYNMLPKYLKIQMMRDEEGGVWFKRIFLILVETHLIEPSADGYCKTKLINVLEDVNNASNYNWCAYVLDVLVNAQQNWYDNPTTPFTGPIAFLLCFYVDRIILSTRKKRAIGNGASGAAISTSDLIDVENRVCLKINATTVLKTIGFKEKDKNEKDDPIGSMTQTLMDEDEEWKDPSWIEAVEEMVTTVEKRVALCDDDGIPSFDLGIEWLSNNETHADDKEDNITRMKRLEKWKDIMENTTEDNLNHIDEREKASDHELCNKSAPGGGTQLVVFDSEKDKTVVSRIKMRSKSKEKISNALRSPFSDKTIKLKTKLNLAEKETYYWIMTTNDAYDDVLVYDDDVVLVTKLEFYSLLPHKQVSDGVICAWCSYLNYMEEYSSPSSPKRLFFTGIDTIVHRPAAWDLIRTIQELTINLNDEVEKIPNFKWDDVDMVFFPISSNNHYYAICFCFGRKSVVILDNCDDGDYKNVAAKYGVIPETVKIYFCEYLNLIGCHLQSKSVINAQIERIKLQWMTEPNKEDCGVYLMRHLETYMGQNGHEWNCGLTRTNTGVLQMMRAKYCSALMLADKNDVRDENKLKVSRYYALSSKFKKIDVEKMITNYPKNVF
ncbi:RING-type E3 ubiquitin transferase [Salvia divinorum]|uniref:RING-type E3 ubiquitin transferase n=1 Tax=Salvia divinorum TaxID=28513 RepID=A0ABD1FWZ1_SALDI